MRRKLAKRSEWIEPTERTNASPDVSHFKASLEAEMAAYDRLPKPIAKWLDEAPKKYSAVEIERLTREGWTLQFGELQRPPKRYGQFNFRTGTWN